MEDESGKAGAVSVNLPSCPPTADQQLTVETETVPSVPTLNVAPLTSGPRVRRSQDSVPRQSQNRAGKRRSQRLAQGSKADIFAAKVAHAVTEQELSDNEETFVYDTQQPSTDSLRMPYSRSRSVASLPRRARRLYADDDVYDTEGESQADTEMPASPTQPGRSFLVPTPKNSQISLIDEDQSERAERIERIADRNLSATQSATQSATGSESGERTERDLMRELRDHKGSDKLDKSDRSNWLRQLPTPRLNRNPASSSPSHSGRTAPSPIRDATDSVRAKHSYLQRWKSTNLSATEDNGSDELDETASLLKNHPHLLDYKARSLRMGRTRRNESDSVFDSDASVTSSIRPPSSTRFCVCAGFFLIFFFCTAFVFGFIAATLRPLQDFDVLSMTDVLVSDRELVFSLIMHAKNPSVFSTTIYNCELDVFATTSHATSYEPQEAANTGKSRSRTLLLGSVYEFDAPVEFSGGFAKSMQWHTGAAKLVDPLESNRLVWSQIIAYDFDLDIKGVLYYKVLGYHYSVPVSTSYKVVADAFL